MPITAREVNEAAGSAEARVARKARSGEAKRSPARAEPKTYRQRSGQPDPTKPVAAEALRRRATGSFRGNTPKVRPRGAPPKTRTEAQSDKSWSRATLGAAKRSGRS
jgi:hypothetical protein